MSAQIPINLQKTPTLHEERFKQFSSNFSPITHICYSTSNQIDKLCLLDVTDLLGLLPQLPLLMMLLDRILEQKRMQCHLKTGTFPHMYQLYSGVETRKMNNCTRGQSQPEKNTLKSHKKRDRMISKRKQINRKYLLCLRSWEKFDCDSLLRLFVLCKFDESESAGSQLKTHEINIKVLSYKHTCLFTV